MTISGKAIHWEQGRHSRDQGRMSLVSTAATKGAGPPGWNHLHTAHASVIDQPSPSLGHLPGRRWSQTGPLTQPGHIFENIPHSNPLSSIFNQISDILHHTEATVPFPNHTGTIPFSNLAHLDGGTNPISNIFHNEATVPFSHIEHSGLSQSFWTEAAGSGELRALAGPAVHPIVDLANSAHLGVGLVSHIPDQINSPAAQLAANHVDAVQHVEVAQLVHPVDPGPVHASFEVAPHVADFAHQIHI
jgi:hypothetical protein